MPVIQDKSSSFSYSNYNGNENASASYIDNVRGDGVYVKLNNDQIKQIINNRGNNNGNNNGKNNSDIPSYLRRTMKKKKRILGRKTRSKREYRKNKKKKYRGRVKIIDGNKKKKRRKYRKTPRYPRPNK
tara:strand:- start:280 stop:666 length:387 start_codon:yes stop_codon:yes gene_type:complete